MSAAWKERSVPTVFLINAMTCNINARMSTTQARMPKLPAVTKDVGTNPTPALKSVLQKEVWLILAGFHLPHALSKVLGPDPKRDPLPVKTFCATANVPCHEGRTSTCETWRGAGRYV